MQRSGETWVWLSTVILLTAHQASSRGWAGAMVKSEWSASLTPSLSSRPSGHILAALSLPSPSWEYLSARVWW